MSDLPFLDQLGDELARRAQRDEDKDERRRRLVSEGAGTPVLVTAALAAAVFAAVAITPGASPTSIAERAYAAVTPEDEIVHTLQEVTIRENGELALDQRMEEWWDGERMRSLASKVVDGKAVPVAETVVAGETSTTYLVDSDQLRREQRDFLGGQRRDDPIAVFRELYRQDKVKPDGTAQLEGREVRRLTMRDGNQLRTWLVDPETYQPIEYRMTVGNPERPAFAYTVRYLTYERLERTPQTLRRLKMTPHPNANVTTEPVKPPDAD